MRIAKSGSQLLEASAVSKEAQLEMRGARSPKRDRAGSNEDRSDRVESKGKRAWPP
jgi:hypothetical protein